MRVKFTFLQFILISMMFFILLEKAKAQLSGTYSIPGDYPTIASAVADLNTQGVGSGGVTFNVAAGHTETISATILLTATGTAADPIVFQKSGTGANPLITAYTGTATPGSASPDGIWALSGSDYVTIDGIDLYDPNTTNPATMEFGYGLFKASATDGCQNVTIKNCTITLNRVNNASGSSPMVEGSVGILVINSTRTAATTALTPTASSGSNSFNKFYSNTIQNCNYGIVLSGYAATSGVGPSPNPATFLGDMENDIGGTSASTGNTILNYGGAPSATNPAAGIRAINQWSINISYNTINNNDGNGVNHVTTLRGIFAQSGTSANATINNNNITIKGGGTTSQVAAIENAIGSTPLSNTVSINNNTITGDYLTATSGAFYGIYSSANPTTHNIQNNTIQNISYSASSLAGSGAVYLIYTTGTSAASTFNITGNTVNNITRTGTTGGTTIGIFASTGTSGMTYNVNNNTVSNMSIDGSGTASTMYGIQTATGTITVNNNNVYNLQCIKTTGTGVLYGIYNISSPTNETINNNNVYGLTHNGTGTVYGIYHYTTTGTRTMSGNIVYNITGAGTTVAGINNASSSPSVFRNRVYNIQSTSSGTPTVSGIILGSLGTSGFANIYNNYISEIKAPNATFTTQTAIVRGINITTTTSSTNIYLYYNTVYLDATSSGANFSSAAIFHTASGTATTANLIMRNNIFVNNSTPKGTGVSVAYWRSGTQLNNYDNSSNNNLFYAGTPSATNLIFFDGTNSDQTIADYKTRVTPRDASSFSENPPFVDLSSSPYDLHIDPSTPTQIESGGIPISTPVAITTDFDGDTRNATTPDVGADEGDFTGLDLTPPTITYTPLGNGIVASTRTFSNVSIVDPSGVNTTSGTKPRVYYKKSTHANTFNDNTSSTDGWKYVEADNSSSPFTFTIDYSKLFGGTGVSVGDVIQYFVVAQDLAPTPNVGINSGIFNSTPSSVDLQTSNFPITGTINSYNIVASISGTKTVGTGGDYPSLTGANGLFADINSKVVTGNITAEIISDLTEDGTHALNQMATEGGSWSLTIVPDAATTRTISGSFAGGLIRLNGADNITIDGRYGGVGNYLTFTNTATSGTIAAIQIISQGTGQGANNVTIRNCNISNGYIGSSTYGIFAGSATLGTAAGDNDNLTIRDNNISKSYYGIYVAGVSGATDDNLQILNNEIGSNTPADYVYKYGIYATYINNADISGNHIFNMSSTTTTPCGIYLTTGVANTTISKNRIHNIAYTGTGGFGGWGIYVNSGSASSNITIHTNVIYDIKGDGWSSFSNSSMVGIFIDGTTGGLNIYYNSVNLYGTFARNTATLTAAMLFNSSSITNVDLRNNVFVNSLDNTNVTTDKNYAIYSSTAASNFTSIDYNDYYASGAQGVLGFIGGSDKTTLSDWQTATGQDANSISANPNFVANDDLRPNAGSPVLNAGTPITGITNDFLGDPRDATPSIGAYENPFIPLTPPNCPNLVSPADGATGVSTLPTLQWTDGGGGTTGYKLYFGTDNPPTNIKNGEDLGNVTSYTFTSALNYNTTYYWKVVSYNANGDASGCSIRSFTTGSDPGVIPQLVNFDNLTPPALPNGWTKENTNGDEKTWNTAADNPRSSPNAIMYNYSSSSAADDWFFSPGLNLQAGTTYEVIFWYRARLASYPERLKVMWGTSANSTAMTNGPIWDNNNITNTTYQKASGTFTPSSSGTYYIGWHCYSAANQWNLYVDDIEIRVQPIATNSQSISGGNTDPFEFTGTGATVQFTTANTGAVTIQCERINSSPGYVGALPSGVVNIGPVYWNFEVTSGTINGIFSLTLDITGIPGVNNPSTLRLLRRSNPNSPWTDLGTPSSVNGNLVTWSGLTGFSEFALGGDNNNPLPVELTSFTARVKDRDVTLEWNTAQEVNSLGFEIERKSINEKDKSSEKWEKVDFVRGNGNSNKPMSYSYVDKKLNTGKYAYRLKMVDIDGSFTYSDEVRIEIGKPAITELKQNYPNSFNPETKIEYQLSNPSFVKIEVYNITGELVTTLVNRELDAGYYIEVFNANNVNGGLSSGVYIYRMIANDRVTGQRIVQTKKMLLIK